MTDTPDQQVDPRLLAMTPADLVDRYTQLRDLLERMQASVDEDLKRVKSGMDVVQRELLRRMNADGTESVKTTSGTAYMHRSKRAQCGDWNAFHDFILATGKIELLQKSVARKPLEDYLTEGGEMPPGVTLDTVRQVRIRKTS